MKEYKSLAMEIIAFENTDVINDSDIETPELGLQDPAY